MKLKQLIEGLPVKVKNLRDVDIVSLTNDSRTASPGALFLAKRGTKQDSSPFAESAVQSGAVAILTDLPNPFLKVPQILHPNPSELEAVIASRFYGAPDRELTLVGVTGTKGKTTTSYLLQALLPQSGLLTTVETVIGERRFPSTLTTHDRIANERYLREMVKAGCRSAVLEVSSHGLTQGRVAELAFDAALFTNLTPDHLDYHPSISAYAEAKRELFRLLDRSPKTSKLALFNGDDPWTPFMREGLKSPSLQFGWGPKVDIRADNLELSLTGSRFQVGSTWVEIPLIGRHNATNALGAIALAMQWGLSLDPLRHIPPIPGRLERIFHPDLFFFVDYAHSGESLTQALSTLRSLMKGGKLIVIFGCGGERDRGRRSGMAQAAETLADISLITTDNPRSEDPTAIAREIVSGFQDQSRTQVILDRKEAIRAALQAANRGDTILLAGKGHESGQIFADRTLPFDDRQIARELLQNS